MISDSLEIEISNAPTIIPLTESVFPENIIIPGEYIVGEGIEEGVYYLKRLNGYGSIEVFDNEDYDKQYIEFKQDIKDEDDRIKYIKLCKRYRMVVYGSLEIEVFRK